MGQPGRERILTLQGALKEEGIEVSIRKLCTILGYHRSNIYYAPKVPKKVANPDADLVKKVRAVIDQFPTYGTRRITWVLRKQDGVAYNHKRIHRIITMNGWQCRKRPSGLTACGWLL
ncbi:IS3 family transposase [Gracilinema caldarium]|uniref:IS3 family transposase n=1 Tax=Gracilinema caldarium TaxID=215591 RepID=UPI0034E94D45